MVKNTGAVLGIILVVVLVLFFVGGAGMMGWGGYGYGMMGPMMGGYGGMTLAPHASAGVCGFGAQGFGLNPWAAILSLVFWALIIAGIVMLVIWLVRNAGQTGASARSSDPALELLQSRYAKGEITKEQFEEMRRTLAR